MQDMIGLNLSQNYPDLGFQWLSSVSEDKRQDIILYQTTATSFHMLSNLTFINHPTI
jgi:hypothetical protein